MRKFSSALLVLALVGAAQLVVLSAASAQTCDPTVEICDPSPAPSPTDPTPTTDPSPTPTTDPTTPPPSPTGDPSPSAKPSASQLGPSAKPSGSVAAASAASEGCGSSNPAAGAAMHLTAPNPPYVVPEPTGMTGPQNTGRVEAILSGWEGPSRVPRAKAFLAIAGPFPVAGPASWSNDWHAYRPCPYPHLHRGLDIFAARGTPTVASEDGQVTQIVSNAISGLAVEIQDRSGIQYFYAHLSAFVLGLHTGQLVTQGQVIGFVGNTGDAAGGAYHLHFEIQPGGLAMPPKPVVDRWLLVAERRATVLVSKGRDGLAEEKQTETVVSVMGLLGEAVAAGLAKAPLHTRAASSRSALPVIPLGGATALLGVGAALGILRFRRRRAGPAGRRASADAEVQETPAALLARMVLALDSPEWPPELTDDMPEDGVVVAEPGALQSEAVVSPAGPGKLSLIGIGLLAGMMLTRRSPWSRRPPR
jgi:murein DD-endopeptidase MepM/ murein hydrolase activator NlpD